jgi:hypothetical protein
LLKFCPSTRVLTVNNFEGYDAIPTSSGIDETQFKQVQANILAFKSLSELKKIQEEDLTKNVLEPENVNLKNTEVSNQNTLNTKDNKTPVISGRDLGGI